MRVHTCITVKYHPYLSDLFPLFTPSASATIIYTCIGGSVFVMLRIRTMKWTTSVGSAGSWHMTLRPADRMELLLTGKIGVLPLWDGSLCVAGGRIRVSPIHTCQIFFSLFAPSASCIATIIYIRIGCDAAIVLSCI